MKVLINNCYGGFFLSPQALNRRNELAAAASTSIWKDTYDDNLSRSDPYLIQAVEELGLDKSAGNVSSLKIVEIPDDVDYIIQEYDGSEWIAENHRTWS